MRKLRLFLPLWLAFVLPSTGQGAGADWEPTGESEGIKTFRKEVPGSALLAFKGEGAIDAPIAKVATVIFDTTRAPEWVVDLEEARLVRWVTPTQFIEYDHIGTPPIIMKDRDFLSLVTMTVDRAKGAMSFLYKPTTDPAYPDEGKYVRGELMNTTFHLSSVDGGARTYVIGEIHCDPKGGVPKWIVNFFQKSWPVDTFKNLRKQVAKPDVKTEARFVEMFGGKAVSAAPPAPAR